MRNLKYRIVCFIRRKTRFSDSSIAERLYIWSDRLKDQMDYETYRALL